MAYMNQEKKAKIAAKLKEVLPRGWKYTLRVRHHSTIVMTIQSAPVDLMAEATRVTAARQTREGYTPNAPATYVDVNVYHPHFYFDESLPVIQTILAALNEGNHNRSDIQSDYFDVGWYVDIYIGTWDKPFKTA